MEHRDASPDCQEEDREMSMPVVYGDLMVAPSKSYSPSSFKPQQLVEYLDRVGHALELHEPAALSCEDLCLAHDPSYVEGVLSCAISNGFGNRDAQTAATLRYTSGSLYRAACLALEGGIAASFSSGFHHAGYRHGGGFCTFNGLVVAARRLFVEGRVKRVLILDADYHYGDGTDDILERLELDFVRHETLGEHFHRPEQGEDYLAAVQAIMDSLSQNPVDLILYQAGADVHRDDPLGGVLSTEQMARRDRIVFEGARARRLPLAWNLAGGYQRDEEGSILPVLRLHEQTYRIAMSVFR
jgi:acetoin utilization deacetylase AcuC-like enzyme